MGNKRCILTIVLFLSSISMFSQKKWSLEDCINHAKENNIQVIKQKINTEIAQSDILVSKGNYLPDVNFSASQNFSLGNSFNVSTSVGQRESSSNSFRLSSSINLFNGFANKYKLQKSKLAKLKSESDIENLQFDLSLDITNKYLQVLFNKEILKVAEEQVNISSQNFNRLKKLYDNAIIGKKEVLEIESTLASDKKEKVIAKNNLKNSLIELQQLLDIEAINDFDVKEITEVDLPLITFNHSEEVVENNPLIGAAALDLEIANKDVYISKANFFPKLNLSYSYSSNYFHILGQEDVVVNQQTGKTEPNGFWIQLDNNRTHYIGISATIPIFNRFLTRQNYNKSKFQRKILESELKNKKQILRNKIQIAKNDLQTAKATFEAAQVAYSTQKEVFEISQRQFENGNLSNYEFLESKNKFIRNSSEHIKAKYEYFFKSKILNLYSKF